MKVDPRFLTAEGREIFTGNELLLKGALEAEGGVHLLGGYPGSPVAAFFDALPLVKDLLAAKGVHAVINNNEALAAAMLNGAQSVGCRAMIVMKSVGVHVAADGLAMGNLTGAHPSGGAVVICGDDPWSDSTQCPADSRYILRHLFMPVVEPADSQEVKDYVGLSLALSRGSGLYIGYILNTNLADGGGTVVCRPNQFPLLNTHLPTVLRTADIDLAQRVNLPPNTWRQEATLNPRLAKAVELSRKLGMNRLLYSSAPGQPSPPQRKPIGFITGGLAHGYLVQALEELALLGELPVLKLGLTYPVDAQMVRLLAQQCQAAVVIEERRGFLEEQVSQIVLQDRQAGLESGRLEVWGKKLPAGLEGVPDTRGLHPSLLVERLAGLMEHLAGEGKAGALATPQRRARWQQELLNVQQSWAGTPADLPPRLPTFCPGCPHRETADVCLEIKRRFLDASYMQRVHKTGPVDLLFHGDAGCYVMLMFPPNETLMHDYSGMGMAGGTGAGADPFVTNRKVAFMGDGTFFHSGALAISQAIKLGQDITFIILDNRTIAMTGHQPPANVDYDVLGRPTAVQDVADVVSGMAGSNSAQFIRADPTDRKPYMRVLEQTFLSPGVKVVVADRECGIMRLRRQRRAERAIIREKGYLPTAEHININQELCRFCLACAKLAGCPGLKHVATDYGAKMDTDITWCAGEGACERLRACPAFERVTIKRKRKPKSRVPELALDEIPEPSRRPVGELWRCCLAGVGGMGIGLATQILVRAGHKEGYPVLFWDKKGLAIRNGGVLSNVLYDVAGKAITAVLPYGKADVLIGVDILEAARAVDGAGRTRVASPERTAAVINTDKITTIEGLYGRGDFDVEQLQRFIACHTRQEDSLARNISRICEKYLGSKLYVNIMMLGFAFQKGLIPVSMHSMAWAIKDTIRADFRKNLYAFDMGRKLVESPELFQGPPRRTGWRETLEDKCRYTIRRYRRGQQLAGQLQSLTAEVISQLEGLEETLQRDVVVRIYDCMRWGGISYARRYGLAVAGVYQREQEGLKRLSLETASGTAHETANGNGHGKDFPATRALIHNLAAAMLIPDIVYQAELARSPEKLNRDREKYNVSPANGDKIIYRHLLHPELRLLGSRLTLDLSLPGWVLNVVKRMPYLRRLHGWQRQARQFLHRYEQAVAGFAFSNLHEYCQALLALANPRCLDCRTPSCQEQGCELESRVPRWLGLAQQGKWQQAAEALHAANNFPEFTARICPAHCQRACHQAIESYAVQIRQWERQIVDRAFAEGWVAPRRPASQSGKRVAIIGSGPAGLAAAQQLARAGHAVSVFEKDPLPGGLLRYGVPEFRLQKALLDRRLEQLQAEGVVFRTGLAVGEGLDGGELLRGFDAVLLACGAAQPRELKIPGRQSPRVVLALDYLRAAAQVMPTYPAERAGANGETASAAGQVVAVIGGGETGDDCVETALRAGAKQVYQLEILSEPAGGGNGQAAERGLSRLENRNSKASESLQQALALAQASPRVQRLWGVATRALANNGAGLAVKACRVAWLPSARGKAGKRPVELAGTEFELNVDLVVLALGFEAVIDQRLAGQLGVALDERGRLTLNDYSTTAPKVFAAGDLVSGPSLLAKAIFAGRQAAERIDRFLRPAPMPAGEAGADVEHV